MISNETIKATYTGNGTTRRWPIPFAYTDKEQIFVALAKDEVETPIAQTDFWVDEDTQSVVYPNTATPAIASDTTITIYRYTDRTQEADLTNQGGAWPETIESGLDKLTQIVQELTEVTNRCLKTDITGARDIEEYIEIIKENAEAAAEAATASVASASASVGSAGESAGSATAAANSATSAHEAESAALSYRDSASSSASAAAASETLARDWAVATGSPDGGHDVDSPTHLTQSSRTWALYSKEKALESAASVYAAAEQASIARSYAGEAAESEHDATAAAAQCQRIVDDAVAAILENYSLSDKIYIEDEDGEIYICEGVIDEDTGEVILPTSISFAEAVAPAGTTIWIKPD